jgi:hypothetical protein
LKRAIHCIVLNPNVVAVQRRGDAAAQAGGVGVGHLERDGRCRPAEERVVRSMAQSFTPHVGTRGRSALTAGVFACPAIGGRGNERLAMARFRPVWGSPSRWKTDTALVEATTGNPPAHSGSRVHLSSYRAPSGMAVHRHTLRDDRGMQTSPGSATRCRAAQSATEFSGASGLTNRTPNAKAVTGLLALIGRAEGSGIARENDPPPGRSSVDGASADDHEQPSAASTFPKLFISR